MTTLYAFQHHILIDAGYNDPAEHRHLAAHVIISKGGTLQVSSAGTEIACCGILIPPGVPHRIDTGAAPALVFLFDSTTNTARNIQTLQAIPRERCSIILERFHAFEEHQTADHSAALEQSVLACIGVSQTVSGVTDGRIRDAMALIRAGLSEPITCQDIATRVFLSQSRFSHLFLQQAGMTFSAYLICQRLLYVYARLCGGCSITEAALEAGFSSSAHFAAVNRRVFGLPASRITENLTFLNIQ